MLRWPEAARSECCFAVRVWWLDAARLEQALDDRSRRRILKPERVLDDLRCGGVELPSGLLLRQRQDQIAEIFVDRMTAAHQSRAGLHHLRGSNNREAELMQKRSPVGSGPSGNTWPR